eukprot:CAMPEP_0170522694 /NCGR_PEP_ID=MMETSP0209-20121228/8121_1 /TAXON_ID=665100 ORGANISM="Litonotus pictus, Strain P1" /NCGR_SAMPLE_ID=MMETSP0209 /ASSEMBLY_ACC=CAM_ASM_000301 /LENGTH=39 /DNA_ID= /DNA_START= /DNA_END= /DNA_ORIENTATION=
MIKGESHWEVSEKKHRILNLLIGHGDVGMFPLVDFLTKE